MRETPAVENKEQVILASQMSYRRLTEKEKVVKTYSSQQFLVHF